VSRVGQYRHIPVEINLNLETIAERCVETNYGVHNMLSAIVIAYKRKYPERFTDTDTGTPGFGRKHWDIVLKVEQHLDAGDF
jgi:hypothetical protein